MGGAAFEILGVQKMPKDIETGGAGFTEVDMGRRRADEGAVTAASSEATTVSLSESAAPAATSAPSVTSTPSTPSVPTTPAVPTVPVAGSGEGGDDTLWFLAEVRQALLGLMSAYYVAGLGDGAGGPEQVQIVAELAAKLVSYKP